jgi:hypothetical protein
MEMASDRSILALKPPFKNLSAPLAPRSIRIAVKPAKPAPSVPSPSTKADAIVD